MFIANPYLIPLRGSGLNLLLGMNISSKFDFINCYRLDIYGPFARLYHDKKIPGKQTIAARPLLDK